MTTVRESCSSQFPFSQRVRSMKSVCLAMSKAEKAGILQTSQPLCEEDSWLLTVLFDGFQESLHYQESRCLFQCRARMSRALSNFCYDGRPNFCPSSMSCQSCRLMGCSWSNPVHIDHKGTKQVLTYVNVLLQRVRSMKRVSFAMLKAEKEGVFQAPQAMFQEVRKSLGC